MDSPGEASRALENAFPFFVLGYLPGHGASKEEMLQAHLKVAWLRSRVHHSLLSGLVVGETSLLLSHLPAPHPDRQGRELY